MKKEEKIAFAKSLEALGVDVIEAGFPIASLQDFEAVQAIAEHCRNVEICALARCNEKDIVCAMEALAKAARSRIHVFIATSEIHMEHKLKMSRDAVIERAIAGVRQAKAFTPRVEFSAEDASRSDLQFLVRVLEAVIEAGADVLNIPDTVGFMTPNEYGDLIGYLIRHVKEIEKVVVSTHCHDDLGLAVANSLAGVWQGARQIECTINGVGERAGNAALEEVVMVLKTKKMFGVETSIQTLRLLATSRFLSEITGHKVPPNKAIVGRNAFAHGSGIHQHGMLAAANTYEIMDPQDVGFEETEIVLTKHSGKHAIRHRLEQLGMDCGGLNLEEIFVLFKVLADEKKIVTNEELISITKGEMV